VNPRSTEAPREAAARIRAEFTLRFGRDPDVLTRAPGRVNLMGEHTDYNRGLALPIALPQATFVAAARRSDDQLVVHSLQQAQPWSGSLSDLEPRTVSGWPAYVVGTMWAMARSGTEVTGMDAVIGSTVPVGAGLSSSAALECSVAVAVASLAGEALDHESRLRLVAACVAAETEYVGAPTGGMDQSVALLARPGSALLVDFDRDDSGRYRHLDLNLDGLQILVTDTKVAHALVDGGYGERRRECDRAADLLGLSSLRRATRELAETLPDEVLRRRVRHVLSENDRVLASVAELETGDLRSLDNLGARWAASHASLRDDFEVSCPELDTAVAAAVETGAVAARMTGGGFGGSVVALVGDGSLDVVTRGIDAAFARRGFGAPSHHVAAPGQGATVM
jgi:galactokinase